MKKLLFLTVLLFSIITQAQLVDSLQFANWIKQKALVLQNQQDWDQLAALLQDKPIIGIGEAVHGSKTLEQKRLQLAKNLIENYGYNRIALEMSFNTGLRLQKYIETGIGDPKTFLKQSHYFLNNTNLFAFIEWLRLRKTQGKPEVLFFGFDIQSNLDLLTDIYSFYKNRHPELATMLEKLQQEFEKGGYDFGNYTEASKATIWTNLKQIQDSINQNQLDHSNNRSILYIKKRLEVWKQELVRRNSGYAASMKMRDSCNADLIEWMHQLKTSPKTPNKTIVLAHNGHLGTYDRYVPRIRTMKTTGFYEDYPQELLTGYYLKKKFKENYFFIGTQFTKGSFTAYNPKKQLALDQMFVSPPEQESLPFYLSTPDISCYYLPFNFSGKTPRRIIHYICSLQAFYEIGAAYDFKYSKARLISYFDAILFVQQIEPIEFISN
ncbi:MAG: erythromycin esterase family protein [Flavobacteriaceae bacterium]|nr:erythromycin esterase family protein [Flavobacteriaceae bacterium]